MDEVRIPQEGDIVTGKVVKVTQEEVLVDIGFMFEGSIYKDHLSNQEVKDARDIVKEGDEITAKITKLSYGDKTDVLLLSRRDLEKKEIREKHIEELTEGSIVSAKVKKSNPGGLELDYHGIGLFMPNSMISMEFANDDIKKELVHKTVEVKIIEVREEKGQKKFIANRKTLLFDALKKQEKAELSKFEVGQIVKGEVSKILDFGAVVQLSDMVDGLIHISELSHFHTKSVEEVVHLGDKVEAKIIKVQGKKISLSLKALEERPWDLFLKNHKVGEKVQAKVVKKMQFGMLLEVEKEISGLMNRIDYSWDPQDNLAGKVEVGDIVECEITSINPDKEQFTLSRKHLEYNPWADLKVRLGEVVSGTIKSIQEKGAIVEVEGVDAYLPIGEISEERINRVDEVVKVGDVVQAEVVTFFPREWKMVISIKKVTEKRARKEYEEQLKENVSSSISLADLFEKYKK